MNIDQAAIREYLEKPTVIDDEPLGFFSRWKLRRALRKEINEDLDAQMERWRQTGSFKRYESVARFPPHRSFGLLPWCWLSGHIYAKPEAVCRRCGKLDEHLLLSLQLSVVMSKLEGINGALVNLTEDLEHGKE